MTFDEMKKLVANYKPQNESLTTTEISGKGEMIGGIWYYQVDAAERSRIHNRLKEQLIQAN